MRGKGREGKDRIEGREGGGEMREGREGGG